MVSFKHEKIFVTSIFSLFFIFIFLFIFVPETQQSSIFFRQTQDYMMDYHNVINYSANLDPYQYNDIAYIDQSARTERIYPPLAYLIFYLLGKGAHFVNVNLTMNLFMLFCSFFLFFTLYEGYYGKKIYRIAIISALMCSSIFLFSYERGNIIILVAACCAFFIFNFCSEDKIIKEIALIALAFATALKISPALLGLLLLFEKRWKEAFRVTIYGAVLAFLPFIFFDGSFRNICTLITNVGIFNRHYEFAHVPRFNFRYWAPAFLYIPPIFTIFKYTIFPYFEIVLGFFAVATAYFHKERWKQIMQLLLVFSVLMINSFQYTGLYMFAGIILFFNSDKHSRFDGWFTLLFILLLNPLRIIIPVNIGVIDLSTMLMNLSASIMLIILTTQSTIPTLKFIKSKMHS